MASIERREGKNGISYRIVVFQGRDINGKQVRCTKTWTPAPGMTEKKMEKEVQRIAFEFEQALEQGYQLDNRQTFAEYAEYVLDLKEREGTKYRTLEIYRVLLRRINQAIGGMKISDVRPQHLNKFYKNLQEHGIRDTPNRAIAKADLPAILKSKKLSRAALSRQCGIAESTVCLACRGKPVVEDKAHAIAKALEMDFTKLFTLAKPSQEPLSNATIERHHALIHVIMAQAEKEMLIPYNPASKASVPKAVKKEAEAFQPEEIERIRDAADQEPINRRMLIHMFLITGARRGEICGLKWEKVDFEKCTIKIDHALLYSPSRGVYEDTTKTRSSRTVKLPQETMQLLRKYRAWQMEMRLMHGDLWHDTGYVFTSEDGKPINPSSISSILRWFEKRHDLPHINAHKFRHTMASILYYSGADPVSISKRLGHADVSTTQNIYSHWIEQADVQSAEMIADAFLRKAKRA